MDIFKYLVITLCLILIVYLLTKPMDREDFGFLMDDPNNLVNRKIDIDTCYDKKGRSYCNEIFPETYRIYDKDDIDILKNKCNPNDIFILKKIWGESRNGLKLARCRDISKNDINRYDQIQRLITNSLKIKNRVFHIRIYLIVDCDRGIYLFNNGLVLYSKEKYNHNRINFNNVITASMKSGYQDFTFYKAENIPKTLQELYTYLDHTYTSRDKNRQPADILLKNLLKVIKKYCFFKDFCDNQPKKIKGSYYGGLNFQNNIHLYGPDILVDHNLNCYILEVNQSPALKVDEQDRSKTRLNWQYTIKEKLLNYYKNRDFDNINFHKII